MKKQKSISLKSLSMALSITMVLTMVSCGAKVKDASNEKSKTTILESTPNPPSMDIWTASLMGNLEAINQHIKAGTDLNKKDPYGSTPLIIAATFDKIEVAKALINAGADLSISSNDGSSPLHTAAFLCRKEIVKALLDKGADKSAKNNYGSTALDSVSGSFDEVKPIYEQLNKDLGPLGLRLDFEYLEKTRPAIAEMLR